MPPYEDNTAEEVDDMPASLKEGMEDDEIVIEGENISGAEQMERSDVIDPAKGVEMIIHSVTVDSYTPQGENDWQKISLRPRLIVAEKGVDGKGRYKNKNFFPRILVKVNKDAYPEKFTKDWWQAPNGGAYGDYNAFLKALGFPTNPAPKNDKAFRDALKGKRIIVDITKDRRQVYDRDLKKYVNTDEHENGLIYKGAPKAAPKAEVAEAAAS
jgi:hypothetical protein